ncbi:MAG: S8 family serine peptidase [Sphingobacteriales bacterium]|nr:S8 family serine peptidase [Sphingobacteriales bacterium]
MRPNPIPLTAACLLLFFSTAAQDNTQYKLYLKAGTFIPEKNITTEKLEKFNQAAARTEGRIFTIIQFERIPGEIERKQMQQAGIELLDYIPNLAYTAIVSGSLDSMFLTQFKTRALIELPPSLKMEPSLAKGNYPSWSIKSAGSVDVWISFPKIFSPEMVRKELLDKDFPVLSTTLQPYRIFSLRVSPGRLEELAALPIVEYVQAIPHQDQSLNYNSMFASRANQIKASLANGGRNLNGQGVVVGIGDDGDPQTHLDFTGRLINRVGERPRAHASHVTGTVGGAGIIQELYAGYAPKSTLLSQVFSNIYTYAPTYVQDFGMVITNNSYGAVVDDCDFNGLYDLSSRILDQQAFDLPELQHVFAAGNDGNKTCTPYPAGFRTVLGGYQSAKNVLTVGSTDYKSDWSSFSSKGPVRDGRLKPEIMSMGQFEASTWTNNIYSYNNGTSMAAPGVSGGLSLLIQRYRQLHGGANPKSGLMKALLCNGANDRGNAGPDFSYGFGQMNLLRSVAMIENTSYFSSSLSNGASNSHSISVPANTAQLKVLLYWQDPPAAVMASRTLVNDLDLQLTTPSASTVLPSLLDTLAANVNVTAGTGADHMNNIEQVIINNPATGNYSLKAIGTSVTQGSPQEYFLAYDIIPQSLVLTNPVGGEAFTPNGTYFFGAQVLDTMYVQWDDYSVSNNETYTLEFSSDGGNNWSTLSNNIPSSARLYKWAIPNIPTDAGRIRLSKNNTAFTQTSFAFVITALPVISLSPVQCEGYISISWAAVPGATDYEAMILQGNQMVSVGTTTGLTYTFNGLSKDSVYWVTMRARINGNPGRRANALSRQPNNGTCAGSISDNDLKIDAIISPASSGRKFTSSELSGNVPVTIRIKNLDDNVSGGNINVSYSINGGAPVNDVITSPIADIPPGGSIDYTFGTNANLSATGTYNIIVTVTKASDPVIANNTVTKVFRQLNNVPITNNDLPWKDNFDAMPVQSFTARQMGLTGNERYDFVNSSINGRIRSFINTGMSYSGSRALTLDMDKFVAAGNTDSLTGTFNLAAFNTATDDIRIDFRYKNHGQLSNAANRVWIRGSENDSWIQVYDLFTNQNNAEGTYKLSTSIELSDSLAAHGQIFSSSSQVKWGQWGQYMAADNESAAGYSFDDIRIYRAINDIQMISIDTPTAVSCGLNSSVPVKVTVHNSSAAAINNIPVVLKVDGSVIATETITSIAANGYLQYTFTATANLAANINHTIETWTGLSSDSYHDNDTARITVNSLPIITSFPYLQNFEADNGSWYSGGRFSSWEYGLPISPKINRAASGTKVWKTRLAGYYNDLELSYLYSPCFNLSGLANPMLSFSFALNIEDCGNFLCDAAWVEYSINGGATWSKLGSLGQGTNWYNKNYSGNQLWSQQNYTRWHVATTALPATNNSNLRLRFVFSSDNGVTKDGIAIDDVHIYNNANGIYDVVGNSPVVNQNTGGSGWTNFVDAASNKIIASVNSGGQNPGSTDVQAFITTPPVRNFNGQYYLNRNTTIKPANEKPSDSVSVRLYFLDRETDSMVFASGCTTCPPLATAYDLGVSQYSDSLNQFENGSLTDDTSGVWHFIPRTQIIMVPYLNGYYSEFKVKGFSEFWLNTGGAGRVHPLRNELLQFTAQKVATNNVLLQWTMASENNITRYDIEVAKGNDDLQNGRYTKIGQVNGNGNANVSVQYNFTDAEQGKTGTRYYRLKIIYTDGGYTYSGIRPVLFPDGIIVQVYPNPTTGIFNIVYQMEQGQQIHLNVMDVTGRLLKEVNTVADGFLQKQVFDFNSRIYPAGIYLFRISAGDVSQVFKVVKQ